MKINPISNISFASNMSQEQKDTFLKNKDQFLSKMQEQQIKRQQNSETNMSPEQRELWSKNHELFLNNGREFRNQFLNKVQEQNLHQQQTEAQTEITSTSQENKPSK